MRTFACVCLAALVAAVSWPALAQEPAPCMTRDQVAEALATRFGETPVSRALSSQGNMVEVFATPDGATWTAVGTHPNHCAELLDAGTDWQAVAAEPAGDPS